MNATNKLATWCYVVFLCAVSGLLGGMICDRVLWEWSYDYVFPANYCRDGGFRLGLFLGTIVAAATVLGRRPFLSVRWTTTAAFVSLVSVVMIALVFGGIGWMETKIGWVEHGADGHHPLSRMAFCSELVRGASIGAWIAGLTWTAAAWRHRSLS